MVLVGMVDCSDRVFHVGGGGRCKDHCACVNISIKCKTNRTASVLVEHQITCFTNERVVKNEYKHRKHCPGGKS